MKRIPKLVVLPVLIVLLLSGCSSGNRQDIFGVYEFKEVAYLSPIISATKEALNRNLKGTKYTIREDLFKVESNGYTVEYSSPKYVKEELGSNETSISGGYTYSIEDAEHQYTVYDKYENKTGWRLYVSKDRLWISQYNDNTKNGSEIIMYIYELSE